MLGVLKFVVDVVCVVGGLFVVDEVQLGFGCLGDEFWGFQCYGIDLDIVLMGKLMGNGYLVVGIVVVLDVVECFGRDMCYFNMFGGNGVVMVVVMVILQVVWDENL